MRVRAMVSEADIRQVRVGQKVSFTPLGSSDKVYESTLLRIEPTPERVNNAVFFRVLFDVPNPDGHLFMDTTAEVKIELDKAKDVLTMPLSALLEDGKSVFVRKADGSQELRRITTGLRSASHIEVKNGLRESEQVVIRTLEADDGKSDEMAAD
jgi:macrolide-specific efflux system membrane fusion protein